MQISIITATYNSAATIADCIASVNKQISVNIEHIIIDGKSKDNTIELINALPNRITNLISEPDMGIYDALNKGIQIASGDIIGFLHSDDLFDSAETLFHIHNTFLQTDADIVYGDLLYIDKKDTEKGIRYWKSQTFKPELLKRGWMPAHPTIFMRREVYKKHGLFNISLKCAADYDFILRVFRDKTLSIVYLPEIITKMRIGGVSTCGIKNIINKKKEDYLVLKNNQMSFPLWILFAKNVSKIPQLIFKNHKIHKDKS